MTDSPPYSGGFFSSLSLSALLWMVAPTYIDTIDTRELMIPTINSSLGSDIVCPVMIALAIAESTVMQIDTVIMQIIQSRGRHLFKS